jgi:anti-sigma B factor antagonist
MQLQEAKKAGVLIVRPLEKRIDAATATDFKQKMTAWIDGGNRRIVLNLSKVDFIDSSGLGAVISALKKIGDNGNIVICSVKDTVMSLFRLTRMDRVFEIFPSEEEALKTLSEKV